MTVKAHITVTIDDDGEPVKAYETVQQARDAVESGVYTHEDEVDYCPDVPLMQEKTRTEPADFGGGESTGVQEL